MQLNWCTLTGLVGLCVIGASAPYRTDHQKYDDGVNAKRNTLDLDWLRIPNRQRCAANGIRVSRRPA